ESPKFFAVRHLRISALMVRRMLKGVAKPVRCAVVAERQGCDLLIQRRRRMSKFEWSWVFVPLVIAALIAGALGVGSAVRGQEKEKEPVSPGVTAAAEEKPAEAKAEEKKEEKKLTTEEEIAKIKEDAAAASTTTKVSMDTMWVMITGMLVFFMNLGFATVESGMCRAKNCVNILSKNFIVFAVTTIGFWVLGWGLMFGGGSDYIGMQGLFFMMGADNSPAIGDAY